MQPKNYIAYVGQDGGFQSRAMLIPCEEFEKARREEILILKEYSKKVSITIEGKPYHIPNLLIQDYIWKRNLGRQVSMPYTGICNMLTHYADGGSTWYDEEKDEEIQGYSDMKDEAWFTKTNKSALGSGFNHIDCFDKLMNMKELDGIPINVVDGFLVLESNNGKLSMPVFDTVDEMLYEHYFKNVMLGE